MFGTIFQQIRAQRRAAPGCFGFTGARDVVAVLPRGFAKSKGYRPEARGISHITRAKGR